MKRRRNPRAASTALGIELATATVPLLPWLVLAGVGAYVWFKYLSSPAAEAAKVAGNVYQGYKDAASVATDPSKWEPAYAQAQAEWQAQGGEGSPIAQPYYGPAGAWSSGGS